MTILDVGSGTSALGHIFLKGNDILHVDRDRAAFHLEAVCDIHHLPFKDNVFQIVNASHILEHVDCPVKAVQELKRVSKNYVIIKVPNASWYKYIPHPRESPEHIYSWNTCTLTNLLSRFFSYVKLYSTTRFIVKTKSSKLRTLKMMLLLPLVSRTEITAICKKSE